MPSSTPPTGRAASDSEPKNVKYLDTIDAYDQWAEVGRVSAVTSARRRLTYLAGL